MSRRKGPWQDGSRAWARLKSWHQDSPSTGPVHPDDGSAAVEALADIGHVRHLLDQAEFVAVRTARRHSKSWAEIATKLGVTRQSAWERWREVDDATAPPPASAATPEPETVEPETVLETAATEVIQLRDRVDLRGPGLRRPSTVLVPNVIGLPWLKALEVLGEHGLVGVDVDPSRSGDHGVVTDQGPESGAIAQVGSSVTLWRGRGGGSAGVREPRRPKPPPKTMRASSPAPRT